MNSDNLITIGLLGIAGYLVVRHFSASLNPAFDKATGTNVLGSNDGVTIRDSTIPGDVKTYATLGNTTYGFRPEEWSRLNYAQRILLRADAAFVPGTWLSRAVLG